MKKVKVIYVLMFSAILCSQIAAQSFQVKNQSVDLRPKINEFGLGIRDQASRGTCTIFATTFLLEYLTARDTGAKNLNFSEEHLDAVASREPQTMRLKN